MIISVGATNLGQQSLSLDSESNVLLQMCPESFVAKYSCRMSPVKDACVVLPSVKNPWGPLYLTSYALLMLGHFVSAQ